MSLHYTTQAPVTAFSAVALTSAYSGNRHTIISEGASKLSLYVNYARGAAEASSKMLFTLEASNDGEDWFSLVIDATSTTSVITARDWEIGTTAKLSVLVDIAYPRMRLSLKESGVSSNAGTATVSYTLSGE